MKNHNKEEVNYQNFTINDIETELKKENYRSKYIKVLKSTIYALIIVAAIALIVSTFIMPVLEISTDAMAPKYEKGDIAVAVKTRNIKTGDIIAFYQGNKILIKRVIGLSNDLVHINEDGYVYVNGKKLNEEYVTNRELGKTDVEFPIKVPNESYFVLSDNRSDYIDSRNQEIGSIKKDNVIGKIKFRIWPLK